MGQTAARPPTIPGTTPKQSMGPLVAAGDQTPPCMRHQRAQRCFPENTNNSLDARPEQAYELRIARQALSITRRSI